MVSLKRPRQPLGPAELTPLIDVVFQLLVFFMLTSAFAHPAVSVDLPDVSSSDASDDYRGVTVHLVPGGGIFIEDRQVPEERFQAELLAEIERRPDSAVAIHGDEDVPYGRFMRILDLCREAGVDGLLLTVEPNARDR